MSLPMNFPLRWESTGDQWWYVSPVDWAAANGHYDVVRELIRLDANNLIKLTSLRRIRRLETVWDDEAQFQNVAKCRSEVARNLLIECQGKEGKDPLNGGGYGGWLLYTAASAGDLGFVQELLGRDPLLVFGEGEYGVTDILYAAARSKNTEVFRIVLDFAAFPRLGDQIGDAIPSAYRMEIMNRALHAAARGGNLKLLKELLRDSVSEDSLMGYRDVNGATILHAAAGRGQVEVVTDLLSSAPEMVFSTDNHGNTPLHLAANRGHLSTVEALISSSPTLITARNDAGETFLHAVISGFQNPCFRPVDHQINLLKRLLNGEIFNIQQVINAQTNKGKTPLHLAITENVHSDLVELLMTVESIDVNIRDGDGLTPLDTLRRKPNTPSSEILTRQLISAGGIFSTQDYSARKVFASHIRKQSMGSSPGTSFRISDIEIFLYTGIETPSEPYRLSTTISPDIYNSPPPKAVKPESCSSAGHPRGKGILYTWSKTSEKIKKLVEVKCTTANSDQVHIPLRQRFSKPGAATSSSNISSGYCNKRPLSVHSSPMAKKKQASETAQRNGRPQKSRSSSFSKLSFSSLSSLEAIGKGDIQCDGEICDTLQARRQTQRNLWGTRRLMNRYLCFGGLRKHPLAQSKKPYNDLGVLSAA